MKSAIGYSLFLLIGGLFFAFIAGPNVSARISATERSTVTVTPTPDPAASSGGFTGYKGVTIGMPTTDARAKLGKPKETSAEQDYFVFSDNESVQVLYDSDHTVRTISVNYIGKIDAAPAPKDVVGTDVPPGADGSINKMVRFPKAGYWISYLRTAGDDPMIVITIQKMEREQ